MHFKLFWQFIFRKWGTERPNLPLFHKSVTNVSHVMVIAIYEFNNKWHHLPIRGINDFCHFFVLICSKETKTEMNTKKVAHDSPHCTLIFCTHNFFYIIASFVPKGYSGFQETWMIILFSSSQLKKNCQIFLPQKNPGIKNFKPNKSFDHLRH